MGFAIQLCYMRYPGIILSINEKPFPSLLNFVADQLKMSANVWDEYGKRDQTRREHLAELQTIFGFQTFSMESYQSFVNSLADLAWQTDKGVVLASALVQSFRIQRILLLTAILADAINLGLRKMTDSCPGTTYAKLSWLQAWHIRDETYSAALAELTNSQFYHPFTSNWGEGTTSSSDGQRFKTAGHSGDRGNINPKYGSDPGVQFYTHISDQYAPFHTKVINVGVRDATYVLDGLLYHESDIRIEEHYTDTSGFTDHVFALMHLLGFRFAPRIRDLADKRLFVVDSKLERVIQHLKDNGQTVNESLLKHLSPLGWEHINLTGDYVWQQSRAMEKGEFRPLQKQQNP